MKTKKAITIIITSLFVAVFLLTSFIDATAQTKRRKTKTSTQNQPSKDENIASEITDGWSYVGSSKTDRAFVRENTLKRKNNVVEGWFLFVLKTPFAKYRSNRGNKDFVYSKQLFAFDCEKNEIKLDTIIDYDISGNTIPQRGMRVISFESVVPDTVGESLLEYACQVE